MSRTALLILTACLAIAQTGFANEGGTTSETNDPLATLQRDIGALDKKMDQQQRELQRRLTDAENKLNEISSRLGEGFGRTTTFNTIERRLTAVEKKLDELDRLVKRIDSRLTTLERKR
jgi:chromosome segregation ATPase